MSARCARYARRAKVEQVKQLRHARQQDKQAQGRFLCLHVSHVTILSRHAGAKRGGNVVENHVGAEAGTFYSGGAVRASTLTAALSERVNRRLMSSSVYFLTRRSGPTRMPSRAPRPYVRRATDTSTAYLVTQMTNAS